MLSICLNSYLATSQIKPSSTGKEPKSDTTQVTVPITFIKDANAKLIERLYLLQVNKQQDSIINLDRSYIAEQLNIINDFKGRVVAVTDVANKARSDVEKYKTLNRTLKSVTFFTVIISTAIIILK